MPGPGSIRERLPGIDRTFASDDDLFLAFRLGSTQT
jgi:hypothetical protein